MLTALLGLLSDQFPLAEIKLHSTDPQLYRAAVSIPVDQTLYSWAVFTRTGLFWRTLRCLELFTVYVLVRLGVAVWPVEPALRCLIEDYRDADLIIFAGGGSLLRNLDKLVAEATSMPTIISEDPLTAVARGTGVVVEDLESLKDVLLPMDFGKIPR